MSTESLVEKQERQTDRRLGMEWTLLTQTGSPGSLPSEYPDADPTQMYYCLRAILPPRGYERRALNAWRVWCAGAIDSAFHGRVFCLEFTFPTGYPFKPFEWKIKYRTLTPDLPPTSTLTATPVLSRLFAASDSDHCQRKPAAAALAATDASGMVESTFTPCCWAMEWTPLTRVIAVLEGFMRSKVAAPHASSLKPELAKPVTVAPAAPAIPDSHPPPINDGTATATAAAEIQHWYPKHTCVSSLPGRPPIYSHETMQNFGFKWIEVLGTNEYFVPDYSHLTDSDSKLRLISELIPTAPVAVLSIVVEYSKFSCPFGYLRLRPNITAPASFIPTG